MPVDGTAGDDHPLAPHIAWQPICSHAEGDEHLRLRGAVTGAMSTIDFRSLRRYINRATQRLVWRPQLSTTGVHGWRLADNMRSTGRGSPRARGPTR